jgi:hypothetical protein
MTKEQQIEQALIYLAEEIDDLTLGVMERSPHDFVQQQVKKILSK